MKLLPLMLAVSMLVPQFSALVALPTSTDLNWIPAQERKRADLSVELKTLQGKKVSLEDFRNRVVFINVWATWCGPCKEEMPAIAALYGTLHNEGIDILAVTNESPKKVLGFLKQQQFPFTILVDPKEKFLERFRVDRFPTTLVIDKSGRVALHHAGVADWNSPPIVEALHSLMSQSAD